MVKKVGELPQNKCLLCNQEFKNSRGRNTHLRFKHPKISVEEYYYMFYPQYCKVCKKLIPFKGEKYFQYIYCSKKCLAKNFSKLIPVNKGDKKYKEDFLLDILKEIHKKYNGYVTQRLVRYDGRVGHQIYHTYFGSFIKACELAGVPNLGVGTQKKYFKETIIEGIKETYKKTKTKISYDLLFKHTILTKGAVLTYFNSLGEACEKSGVPYYLEIKQKGKVRRNREKILIDTLERRPYNFKNAAFHRLDVGDYKSADNFNGVVFERKSISDLKSTMSGGYNTKRFGREMERARKNGWYVIIIIDGSEEDFFSKKPYGRATNNGLFHNIKGFGSVYADVCQFFFTGSRKESMNIVQDYLNCFPSDIVNLDLQDMYSIPLDEQGNKIF